MKFGFYSCMSGVPWGGSEELWWRTARRLQSENHEVCVNYKWWPEPARRLKELMEAGGEVYFRNKPKSFWKNNYEKATKWFASKNGCPSSWLEQQKPDCVLITIGYHPDRIEVAKFCEEMKIPYAINVQCASNFFFIHSEFLELYRRWYNGATKVFFVSDENQHKLETNLACQLSNAEIVCNPFNIDIDDLPDWPEEDEPFRLACVGRIHFQSKGQDLLVDVLKQKKWRDRNLVVTLYGNDQGNKKQMEELVRIHELENRIKFGGFVRDVNKIWAENHGLLLPSRYEGAPLCVVEAMLCNRMCVTTDIGRNKELMDDGESGFIAAGATISLIDEALERAWDKRNEWRKMGELAGEHVRERFAIDPVGDFAERLKRLA